MQDWTIFRFSLYIFLRNLRLFEPFLIIFFRHVGLSFFQIGILYSVKEITILLMGVPSGVLADAFGRKRTLVASTLSYLISFILFFFGVDFIHFALAMAFYGLGEALMAGSYNALVIDYLDSRGLSSRRVEYLGAVRGWGQMGLAMNGLLAGLFLLLIPDYRWLFAITFVPHFLNLFNIWTLPDVEGKSRRRKARLDLSFLRNWKYARIILNSSLYMAMFRTVKDYVQPILKSFAVSLPVLLFLEGEKRTAIVVGIAYFLIFAMNSYAARNAYRLRRFGSEAMVINLTYLTGAMSVVLAGLFHHMGKHLLSFVVFLGMFLMLNLRRPFMLSYISTLIPHEMLATGMSIESNLKIVASMILSPVLGYMADAFGVGWALAGMGLFFLLLYPLLRV